jgi:hypothetical protein
MRTMENRPDWARDTSKETSTMRKMTREPVARQIAVDETTAARMLGVSARTMFRLSESGEVPCFKINRLKRYRVSALEEYARKAEREMKSDLDEAEK